MSELTHTPKGSSRAGAVLLPAGQGAGRGRGLLGGALPTRACPALPRGAFLPPFPAARASRCGGRTLGEKGKEGKGPLSPAGSGLCRARGANPASLQLDEHRQQPARLAGTASLQGSAPRSELTVPRSTQLSLCVP